MEEIEKLVEIVRYLSCDLEESIELDLENSKLYKENQLQEENKKK